MRKRSIVFTLSVIAFITFTIAVTQYSYSKAKDTVTQEYETTIQQLSNNYEAELQKLYDANEVLSNTNKELANTNEEQKAELKKNNKKIDELKNDLDNVQKELDLINGHIDTMSSIIQEESNPKVNNELANEMALYVWKLNSTYANKFGFEFDPYLTLAFMDVESEFNPKAESYAEAKGITQLTDRTGKAYAKELGYTTYNPFDWKQNVDIGWYYFNTNRAKYGKHKAIVIYNQGYKNLSRAVTYSLNKPSSYLNTILSSEQNFKAHK